MPTDRNQPPAQKPNEPIKVAFSVPQMVGGALAAATAAAIGSQLGVAGTIVGAAVASLIGGVAGTLYSAGIDRTHRKVTQAIQRGYDRVLQDPDAETAVNQTLPETVVMPAVDFSAASDPSLPGATAEQQKADRSVILRRMLISVAAIFVAALLVFAVFQFSLGRDFGGTPTGHPSQSAGHSKAPTPTATATVTVSASPVPSPSASTGEPTPSPTPTPTASETPVPLPTPAATAS